MGCIPCATDVIIPSCLSLRLLPLLTSLRNRSQHDPILRHLLTDDDLQPIPLDEVERLQDDEIEKSMRDTGYLLSKERRTLWKISVAYNSLGAQIKDHSYLSNPQPTPQLTQCFEDIKLDVNRTYPNIVFDHSALSAVLKNLAQYFQGVGYTQGMNFFVGFLLLCGFQAEECFWLFVRLSFDGRFLLIRNFSEGIKGALTGVKLIEKRLNSKEALPLKEQIANLGLNCFFYSFQWVLSFFLYNLNLRCSAMLWDSMLLVEGVEMVGAGLLFLVPFSVRLFEAVANSSPTVKEGVQKLRSQHLKQHLTSDMMERLLVGCQSIKWKEFIAELKLFDQEMHALALDWKGEADEEQQKVAQQYWLKCYQRK